MYNNENWDFPEDKKEELITAMTNELSSLRNKAEISQDELATLIGISRQTYGDMERKKRRMSWGTYLSLVMFYDYNEKTHDMLRNIGVFPYSLVRTFNGGKEHELVELEKIASPAMKDILNSLDDQAFNTIRTMIMLEYSRCTGLPGEAVVKAFDGINFTRIEEKDINAAKMLKAIKEKKKK